MITVMRKILASTAALASYLTLAVPAFADTPTPALTPVTTQTTVNACPAGPFNNLCNLGASDIGRVVGQAIGLVFVLAVVLALGYLVYGAIKWITSEGDKGHVETARNQIIAAIIGLVIIALSYLIMNLVLNFFLPGTSLGNLHLPSLF